MTEPRHEGLLTRVLGPAVELVPIRPADLPDALDGEIGRAPDLPPHGRTEHPEYCRSAPRVRLALLLARRSLARAAPLAFVFIFIAIPGCLSRKIQAAAAEYFGRCLNNNLQSPRPRLTVHPRLAYELDSVQAHEILEHDVERTVVHGEGTPKERKFTRCQELPRSPGLSPMAKNLRSLPPSR